MPFVLQATGAIAAGLPQYAQMETLVPNSVGTCTQTEEVPLVFHSSISCGNLISPGGIGEAQIASRRGSQLPVGEPG